MGRPVHFEIHAEDLDRASAFYSVVFGWTFTVYQPGFYSLITTGPDGEPGINGGLIKRQGPAPAEGAPVFGYVCTIDTADLDATLKTAVANGAAEALPRQAIPGVGWLAYVRDTEGNILGIMQNDPSAA
ncbi:MAG: lactoylglutathione lyase family protein [Caulobacter sp.]|jgi:predicted enzyme related to lactoylglutathione lyase|nr:lactoylglutathione lyase family protein [Caulobacter sp.]